MTVSNPDCHRHFLLELFAFQVIITLKSLGFIEQWIYEHLPVEDKKWMKQSGQEWVNQNGQELMKQYGQEWVSLELIVATVRRGLWGDETNGFITTW